MQATKRTLKPYFKSWPLSPGVNTLTLYPNQAGLPFDFVWTGFWFALGTNTSTAVLLKATFGVGGELLFDALELVSASLLQPIRFPSMGISPITFPKNVAFNVELTFDAAGGTAYFTAFGNQVR